MINKLRLIFKYVYNPYLVFLDRIGLLKNYIVYNLKNNLSFIARTGTEDVSEIVVVASGYEYPLNTIRFSKKSVILDFGGYIGTFCIFAENYLKRKCKILVYEPDKENYQMLNFNLNLNNCRSISSYNLAVSDYSGSGSLLNPLKQNDGYILSHSTKSRNNCYVTTVKDIFRSNKIEKADLIKMDIEGEEYKLFLDKQTYKIFKEKVHYIIMEIHNINNRHNYTFLNNIIKNDFKVTHIHGNSIKLENLKWLK